jgi:hypothetical protein
MSTFRKPPRDWARRGDGSRYVMGPAPRTARDWRTRALMKMPVRSGPLDIARGLNEFDRWAEKSGYDPESREAAEAYGLLNESPR